MGANLQLQRELYGAPLADLAGRVRSALGLTQGRLADTLGLSAPMLSQLVSGQRVKIGNPAVVSRLEALLALADEAPTLTITEQETRLAAVKSQALTLGSTRTTSPRAGSDRGDDALRAIRATAPPDALQRAADRLSDLPELADLAALVRAAAEVETGEQADG